MKNKYFFLLFLIPTTLVIFWFRHGNILGGGESGLPFYNLERQYEIDKYSWGDPAFGNSVGVGIAATPFFRAASLLQLQGIPGFVIEALFFWLLFVTAGVSIWFLTKELFPKLDGRFLLLAAMFYWFNPISLVSVWNRFLFNFMTFWALLPLALFLFLRGIRKNDFRFSLLTSFATVIFSYALTSTVFDLMLWSVFVYITVFFLIFEKKGRLFLIGYLLSTFLTFFLFNFWWISQLFSFIFSSGYLSATSAFFTASGNLATLSELSRRLGQFVDILRFMHGTFFIEGPSWAKLYSLPFVSAISFFAGGTILWTLYKFRREKEILLFGSLFILSIFLAKGNAPPFGEIFQAFFLHISALQVFRNPFEKFSFLILIFSVPLFAIGANSVGGLIQKSRFNRLSTIVFFLLVVGFWGFPFVTGLVFTSTEAAGANKLRNYEVAPPSYYQDANNWLVKNSDSFRFVSLPLGGEAMNYSWTKSYAGVELSSALFETPNISFNTTIPFYNDFVSNLSKYQLDQRIFDFFPYTASKYIVWRSDIDFKERKLPDPEALRDQLEIWTKESFLEKVLDKGKLAIFQINDRYVWPKVYVTQNILYSNENDLSQVSFLNKNSPEEKTAVVNYGGRSDKLQTGNELIVKSSDPFYPIEVPQSLSDQEIINNLLYTRHLPGEPLYFLVRFKEILDTPPKSDFASWISFKTGLLGKRAVEVYRLYTNKAGADLISQAESDYAKSLRDLTPDLVSAVRGDGQDARYMRESLIYQWLLLGRVKAKSWKALSDFLTIAGIEPTFSLSSTKQGGYLVYDFDIPLAGVYKLFGGDVVKKGIYVDGKALEQTEQIQFAAGHHEVAILAQNLKTLPLFSLDDIKVSDNKTVSWNVSLPGVPQTYTVELDFRFREGDMFDLSLAQNIDKPASLIFDSRIAKAELFHDWSHWKGTFTTSAGAISGKIEISPSVKDICESGLLGMQTCKKEKSKFDVEIKNLKITPVENPGLLLVSNLRPLAGTNTLAGFTKINPTLYRVKISKQTPEPEMLVFSELFDSGWEARIDGEGKIPDTKHFLVNVYANGWLLGKAGDYSITLSFQPQRLLDVAKTVSVISLLGGALLLGAFTYRRRKL